MSMKLRNTSATLELTSSDVCKLLTEAVCSSFSMFEYMEIYRVTPTGHGRFRVYMADRQAPPVVQKAKVA